MKKLIISFVSISLSASSLFAQSSQSGYKQENKTVDAINAYSENNNYYTFDNRYKSLKGSPFILSGWNKGDIEMNDSKIIKSIPVKIDAYNKSILVRKENGDSIALDDQRIKSVTLYDLQLNNGSVAVVSRLFKRIPAAATLKMGDVYFEEISNNDGLYFLKHTSKVLKKASKQLAYNNGNAYDEMLTKEDYYICKNDKLISVKLNVKSFEKAIPELANSISSYSAKKGNLRSEKDFAAMLTAISAN